MPKQPSLFQIWRWQRRILRMNDCDTTAELERRCGKPGRKVVDDDVAIWHYPLREVGGIAYSIHVTITGDKPTRAYLHMVPGGGER